MRVVRVAAAGLIVGLQGCSPDPYACSNSSQCIDGGIDGTCQPSGYCSFPDETCPSGQRYAEYAGVGFSGKCVTPNDPTGTDGGSATSEGQTSTSTSTSSGGSTETTADPSSTGGETGGAESTTGCEPDCTGRECGPDGCGGSCAPGCNIDESCQPDGTCVVGCEPTWGVEYASQLVSLRFDGTNNLVVTGQDHDDGWIARVSPCDGTALVSASLPFAGADRVQVRDVAPTDEGWVAVGHSVFDDGRVREAFVATLGLDDLSLLGMQSLPSPMEEAWGVGITSSDAWWITGVANVTLATQTPWTARTDASGVGCGFPAAPGDMALGYTRALAVDGTDVYVGGSLGSAAYVARFDTTTCGADQCACVPTWTTQFEVAEAYNEVRGLTLTGGFVFAGGFAQPMLGSNDFQGFIARFVPPDVEAQEVWVRDPTSAFDAVLGLSSSGDTLYAPMVINNDPDVPEQSVGAVFALSTSLQGLEDWGTELAGLSAAYDVLVDDEAVYVAGRDVEDGWILKCTTDGECPR